ncbi:folylpolyglutamate synthase, mitochondrial-like isoform X2 [Leptopilina heterotoma]|nr:folylpolyglutamate synthase, mitochondrial-like isoform X2 [Leptopilina heterotoma]
MDQVNRLRIIHIAGTKGKGSTCAFTESILRNHGYSTGFYSSPHLVSVRERFRLNGKPISESIFSQQFWRLYKILHSAMEHERDMPQYFKFLTVMMFHIFLTFQVDVAIVEVGIGGENDCTNIIENPICTGITSLALDHTTILGETIDKIAFHKSGIFKLNVPAFTVPQINEAMIVLKNRALEKNCTLKIVPSLENYSWTSRTPLLGIPAEIQNYNASLAIQLALSFINSVEKINKQINNNTNDNRNNFSSNVFSLQKVELGITSCKWPGRTQILRGEKIDFFIDGAHTLESINNCATWFKNSIKNETGNRYLIFNTTGYRNSELLMTKLKKLKFLKAFFSPNISGINNSQQFTEEMELKCKNNCNFWGEDGIFVENVKSAINEILNFENQECITKPKVLVTGSLHLVGALLSIIDSNLTMTTKF